MTTEATQNVSNLESLRIKRNEPPARRTARAGTFIAAAVLACAAAAAGTVFFRFHSGRVRGMPTFPTVTIKSGVSAQPDVLLTGSGYVVTRRKYITIGTKILGQIVADPIEE